MLSLSHARSLCFYRSDEDFGYALGSDVASEEMRLLKSRMREGTVAGLEAMRRGGSLFLAPLLLARKRAKGRKGAYAEEERLMP